MGRGEEGSPGPQATCLQGWPGCLQGRALLLPLCLLTVLLLWQLSGHSARAHTLFTSRLLSVTVAPWVPTQENRPPICSWKWNSPVSFPDILILISVPPWSPHFLPAGQVSDSNAGAGPDGLLRGLGLLDRPIGPSSGRSSPRLWFHTLFRQPHRTLCFNPLNTWLLPKSQEPCNLLAIAAAEPRGGASVTAQPRPFMHAYR